MPVLQDPGASMYKISPEDLAVLKQKFPLLCDFSDQFLRSNTIDELLRIESTSIRIRDAERSRETEDRLANNKANLLTKFYEVPAGKDNRCTNLHPARYLPGAACSAVRQYITAREVIGLTGPPSLGCYDMNAVGMGGFISAKGWLELGTCGSSKMKIALFSINNTAKSGKSAESEDGQVMKNVDEFVLAMRTLRAAAQFVCPWNYSFMALENFFLNKKFMEEELKHDNNPARTLCQFADFVFTENSNRWRDGSGFIVFGDLQGFWDAFVGARPQHKPYNTSASSGASKPPRTHSKELSAKKRKYPFNNICGKYNTNNCSKAAGTCYNFKGLQMQHICNWRDLSNPNSQPCGQQHTRVGNH